jgi:hypothetical protein
VTSVPSNTLVTSIPTGVGPGRVTYDDANGDLYVANFGQGTISIIGPPVARPLYPVDFLESGLPSGTRWSVALDGDTNNSTTTTIGFEEPNGTGYQFAIGNPPGFVSTPSTETFNVTGGAVTETIHFSSTLYPVWFNESGLPVSTTWSVVLNGLANVSTSTSIGFLEPNGTAYAFTIGGATGFAGSPSSGTISVSGFPVTKSIVFTVLSGPLGVRAWGNQTAYGGNFTACQSPNGSIASKGSNWELWTYSAVAWNGTPPYTFTWSLGGYSGSLTGAHVTRNYTSAGGPPTRVIVTATDSAGASNSTTLLFPPPPTAPPHYSPCPSNPSPSTFLGLPVVEGYALVAGIVLAVVAATVAFILGKRRKGSESGKG